MINPTKKLLKKCLIDFLSYPISPWVLRLQFCRCVPSLSSPHGLFTHMQPKHLQKLLVNRAKNTNSQWKPVLFRYQSLLPCPHSYTDIHLNRWHKSWCAHAAVFRTSESLVIWSFSPSFRMHGYPDVLAVNMLQVVRLILDAYPKTLMKSEYGAF